MVLVGKLDENLGSVPKINLKKLQKVLDAIYKSIQNNKILSCHDVSEGGVITSIFEMCVGGNCGVNIKLPPQIIFNETAGSFIVEVENEKIAKQIFKGVSMKILGKTQSDPVIKVDKLFSVSVNDLKKVWQKPMKELFA